MVDLESMTLTEMIRHREHVSEVLTRRFERTLAVVFTDIAGSTAYFAQFGDEAGRGLQQRHLDLLGQALAQSRGRIVDTAGDGALTGFPQVEDAVTTLIQLEHLIQAQNVSRAPEHQLGVRSGVHWGPVLTDGDVLTGDAVNLCARLTATAGVGEIRLTHSAVLELPSRYRLRCRPLPPVALEGITRPVDVAVLQWRETSTVPTVVRLEETGERFQLPDKPVITFGRLREHGDAQANDIVLSLPDKAQLMRISRWHFELRRQGEAVYLRAVSDQPTEVDGRLIEKGQQAQVVPGTVVRLAEVATLTFLAEDRPADETEMQTVHHGGGSTQ